MPDNQVDQAPDAAMLESDAKAARTLGEDEALAALTGQMGAPSLIPDEPEEDSSSPEHPRNVDTPPDTDEDEPEDDDSTEDSSEEDEDTSTDTDNEPGEESAEEEDYFIGLDDDDNLSIQAAPKVVSGDSPAPTNGKLTDAERARSFQSRADKFEKQYYDTEKLLRKAEAENEQLRNSLIAAQSPSNVKAFDKKPSDYMEDGAAYDPEDRLDASTASGQAYLKYYNAYREHEKEQILSEAEHRLALKEQQRTAKERENAQKEYLRSKRPNDFRTQEDIDELINWTTTLGNRSLYAVSLVRDIMTGQFKLPKAAVEQIRKAALPKNGKQTTSSIATKPDADIPPQPKVDADTKVLKSYFADA